MTVPSVRATITLLPQLSHGRWPNKARYMPHIVIGDPEQREVIKIGNNLTENYLGVWVTDAPDELSPGQTSEVTLKLMYWPEERYKHVKAGATFTVREGPNIIGFGTVLNSIAGDESAS